MNERESKIVSELMNNVNFSRSFATAFVRARGRCVYCGEDLLRNRLGYTSAVVYHLLPKWKYPELQDVGKVPGITK